MMAGFVFVLVDFTSFWVGFVISEIIALLFSIRKEGLLMVKKFCSNVATFAKRIKVRVIASFEVIVPYRLNLLKSLCEPSENGMRKTSRNEGVGLFFE
jgi:hypothetical protein